MNALRASLKRNSHWALLAVCSVLSATSTWFSQSQLSDWTSEIDQLRPVNVPTKKIPPADLEALEKAASSLQTPAKWDPDLSTSLFVSERYLLEGGVLRKPENASFYRHSDGRPIENSWFAQYPALAKLLGKPKLPRLFDTQQLAESIGEPRWLAQQVAYVMKNCGATKRHSKRGNAIVYRAAA